jgi:DNA-binding transcriptional ArsR family regulator
MASTDVFGAIANPTRRQILDMLRGGPRAAGEIASSFDVNRPAVSEHLQVLRLAGLVSEEARGRQRVYRLNGTGLAELAEWLHPFEQYWGQRLDALANVLDDVFKKDTK